MKEDKVSREKFWRFHIQAGSVDLRGVKGYCREHKIAPALFYYWKNKLSIKREATLIKATPKFLPVSISSAELKNPAPILPDPSWLAAFAVELIRGLGQ